LQRSFQELGAVHEALFERLRAFREAVALGEPAAVHARFAAFALGLVAHARAEDLHLLPIYARLAAAPAGASAELISAEHDKLRRLLAELEAALLTIPKEGPLPAAARVAILDRSLVVAHLLDHHDERERARFFAGLDQVVRPEELEAVWAACDALHAGAGLPAEPVVTPATAPSRNRP